jgi:hypothetical protein
MFDNEIDWVTQLECLYRFAVRRLVRAVRSKGVTYKAEHMQGNSMKEVGFWQVFKVRRVSLGDSTFKL